MGDMLLFSNVNGVRRSVSLSYSHLALHSCTHMGLARAATSNLSLLSFSLTYGHSMLA